jgi:hypothetical protein
MGIKSANFTLISNVWVHFYNFFNRFEISVKFCIFDIFLIFLHQKIVLGPISTSQKR